MGVKLLDIITRKKIDIKSLEGSIIAIDAPNIIMSLFNFTRKNPDSSYAGLIIDRTQRPISHLYGLLYRINFLYSKKIFPIFCFDGKVSELKKIITRDQLRDFRFYQKWYKEAINNDNKELARKIALDKNFLWFNIIKESKQLLSVLGVPFIDSPASAESQCAHLVKSKVADYSNSQDFDSLLFRCPIVIQNLSKSLRRKVQGKWEYHKITPVLINLEQNLRHLNLSYFQLVDLALLLKTDYFPGIRGIGLKKALKLIKKYHTIEGIIFNEKNNFDFNGLTKELIMKIRSLFLFPDVNEDIGTFYWNFPDKTNIIKLLCKDHHLNEQRVRTNLTALINNYKKCRTFFEHQKQMPQRVQTSLDHLF